MITPDNTRKEDNKGQDGEILGRFERGGSGENPRRNGFDCSEGGHIGGKTLRKDDNL